MSAPQFTPGPWLIHAERRWVVPAEDALKEPTEALPICQLRDPDERLSEDETLGNGFLIAAAPELYEAVRELLDICCQHGIELPEKPAAAYRKARGEQQ